MSNPNFGATTTAEEVASAYSSLIEGKTILVTGVSQNSLGIATAKAFAVHRPALLILAARSQATLHAAVSTIKEAAPDCPTRALSLDLGSIRTVRAAAEEVDSWDHVPKIDILINNAAAAAEMSWKLSEDGIEHHFATNHIGPFLFTNLIVGKVIAAKGRIVDVSSVGHVASGIRFDDLNFNDGKDYDAKVAYGQSKTANILMTVSLASKLKSKGVTAYSLHPGFIRTNAYTRIPRETLQSMGIIDENGEFIENGPMKFKTHSQGSATTVVASLDPNIGDRSGAYLCDCKADHDGMVMPYATDKENAEKLWELSETLVGEKFDY